MQRIERGLRRIGAVRWLPRAVVDRLRSLRGPGESFSDVILRLAAEGELGAIWRIKPNQGRNTAANHDLAAAISLKPPVVRAGGDPSHHRKSSPANRFF